MVNCGNIQYPPSDPWNKSVAQPQFSKQFSLCNFIYLLTLEHLPESDTCIFLSTAVRCKTNSLFQRLYSETLQNSPLVPNLWPFRIRTDSPSPKSAFLVTLSTVSKRAVGSEETQPTGRSMTKMANCHKHISLLYDDLSCADMAIIVTIQYDVWMLWAWYQYAPNAFYRRVLVLRCWLSKQWRHAS